MIKNVTTEISDIKLSLARIEALLVGEDGSGLMARVQCLEKDFKAFPDNNLNKWYLITAMGTGAVSLCIAIFSIFKK